MEKNQKYQLEDYYNILSDFLCKIVDNASTCAQVDLVRNKLGQDSVRVRYKKSRLKEFHKYIFGSDFAVAYKPNGRVKMYESITPKQVKLIVERVLFHYRR